MDLGQKLKVQAKIFLEQKPSKWNIYTPRSRKDEGVTPFCFHSLAWSFQQSSNVCAATFKTALNGGSLCRLVQYRWAACTSTWEKLVLHRRGHVAQQVVVKKNTFYANTKKTVLFGLRDWEKWRLIKGGTCLQLSSAILWSWLCRFFVNNEVRHRQ